MQGTANISQQRGKDVSNEIFLLEPFEHPLITLLTSLGMSAGGPNAQGGVKYTGSPMLKKVAKDPEFYHFEDTYGRRSTTVATAISSTAATTLAVASGDGAIFTVGDIIKVVTSTGTEEQMRVTAISTDDLTVTRGYDAGANKLSSIPIASNVYIVGNASEEGSGKRSSNTTSKTKVANFTQIFKTPFEVTETLRNTDLYTGDELVYQNRKKALEHALDIERALWFGKKDERTGSGGQPIRTTGGVLERINELGSAHITDAGGALTKTIFESFLKEGFQYGSQKKALFCSGTILSAIAGFADGSLQVRPEDKTFGIRVTTWISPHGEVMLVRNPLFTGAFDGQATLIDFETLRYRYLQNRDTKLVDNIQAPDVDGRIDQFLSEVGLDRVNFEKNALLKGVTG